MCACVFVPEVALGIVDATGWYPYPVSLISCAALFHYPLQDPVQGTHLSVARTVFEFEVYFLRIFILIPSYSLPPNLPIPEHTYPLARTHARTGSSLRDTILLKTFKPDGDERVDCYC